MELRQKKYVRRKKTKSKSSWKEIRGYNLEPQKIHFKITTKCRCGKPRVKFFWFFPLTISIIEHITRVQESFYTPQTQYKEKLSSHSSESGDRKAGSWTLPRVHKHLPNTARLPLLALQSTHSAGQPYFLYCTSLHGNLHLICKSLYFILTLKVIIL